MTSIKKIKTLYPALQTSAGENGSERFFLSRLLAVLATVLFFSSGFAQDIHFSQYFNTPLSLNPALTGKVDGTFRLGIDYRNQWFGIGSRKPYSTPAFYGDVPVRFKSKDILGIGLNIVKDKSSGGKLSMFSAVISSAFHKAMGKSKNHFFSFGLQLGFLQKKLDLGNITLRDQIDLQNDATLGSADFNSLKGSDGGFEFNLGFDWSSEFSEHVIIHAGYAAFHITSPDISLYGISDENLPVRHAFNFGADFGISEHFRLHPFFVHLTQAKSKETFTGLSLGIPFNDDNGMYLGSYFRVNDAVVPYLGFDIKGFKLGVSYDMTTSSLEKTSGGVEISLTYTGRYLPVPDVVPTLYCPRF